MTDSLRIINQAEGPEAELDRLRAENAGLREKLSEAVMLGHDELHLARQWFEAVEDCSPQYLEAKDARLATHIYQVLGWRVPDRVTERAALSSARAMPEISAVDAAFAHVEANPTLLERMYAERQADDVAVNSFAHAMVDKMARSQAKGRGGWQKCSVADLWRMLREHVEKGDPVDIANLAMMIHHNNAALSSEQAAAGERTSGGSI